MSYSRASRSDLDDRDFHSRRPPYRDHEDIDIYERRERRSSPARRPAAVKDYEDDIDIHIRNDRERDRVPAFLREENKRTESGPMVLRQREIETVDRRKPRSPSPQPVIRERYIERRRSVSPPPRPASRATPRPRYVERSPSPQRERDVRVDIDTRVIERRRPRSPTPEREPDRSRIRLVIDRERERAPSPSPSRSPSPLPLPPPPPVIKGPTIERQVITHYRDIDHGVERAHPPTPPPAPRTPRPRREERESCETDIDIRRSKGETDIDVRHTHTRSSSRPGLHPALRQPSYDDGALVIRTNDRERIAMAETARRRAHSEVRRPDWNDEAEYITSKIDSRGRMGEAWNGATRDWSIVDVPPGTERVRMDGVGGGGAEVTWQRYNGVRRSKFVPEREGGAPLHSPAPSSTPVSEPPTGDRLSVQIYDSKDSRGDRGRSRDRGRDVEVEEIRDKRISIRESSRAPPKRSSREMWTEITKDLVAREAIEQLGYNYEETEYFFYVMEYLRYEDVVELVNISDEIRRSRQRRAREAEWEREYRDSWDRHHHHLTSHGHSHSAGSRRALGWDKVDDERIVEREIIYDRPGGRYMR